MSIYSRQKSSGGEPTQVVGFGQPENQNNDQNPSKEMAKADSPVVGFLYSISRHGFGEFWPIHTGNNIIGRDEDCDIKLLEKTVSSPHADIRARILKKSGQVIANIKDLGSKNGIEVNGKELRYEDHDLKDGDKILIGNAYEFLFILIDPAEKGLKVAENFCECEQIISDPFGYGSDARQSSVDRTHSMYDHNNRNNKGTVNLDSASVLDSGHTTIL